MRLNVISIVGGIMGFASIPMSWFTLSFLFVSYGVSGIDIFRGIGDLGQLGGVPSSVGISVILIEVGVILTLIGSIVSILHPAGGGVLVAGGAVGIAGAVALGAAFLSQIPPGFNLGISAGPGAGEFLAIIAGVVTLVGIAIAKKEPRVLLRIGEPPAPMGAPGSAYPGAPMPPGQYPAQYPSQYPTQYAPQYPGTYQGYGAPPAPPPGSAGAPAPLGSKPNAPPPPLNLCPAGGRQTAGAFCPTDGTPTKPTNG